MVLGATSPVVTKIYKGLINESRQVSINLFELKVVTIILTSDLKYMNFSFVLFKLLTDKLFFLFLIKILQSSNLKKYLFKKKTLTLIVFANKLLLIR
jgi:hypothetical protein